MIYLLHLCVRKGVGLRQEIHGKIAELYIMAGVVDLFVKTNIRHMTIKFLQLKYNSRAYQIVRR